jgi:hypothetical protein
MIADLLSGLGGVALFALPGLALAGLFPALRDLPWPRRLAYGYLLGIAWVAGGLYLLSFLFGVPLRQPAIFLVAALPLPLLLRWRRSRPRTRRASWLVLGTAAVGAWLSLGVLADAIANPLQDWDGRMTWTTQARYVREAGSVLPPALTEGRWYVSHPRYPLLMPVAQAAVMEAFRADPDRQVFRPLYAAFFPVLLLIVWDGALRRAGARAAALAVLAACGLPLLGFGLDGGANGAYSDLPLACFYGAALVLLLRSRLAGPDGVAAGLLLGAAVLTKNEGAVLAAAALLAAGLFQLLRHRGRRRAWLRLYPAATATVIAFLALVLLTAWRAGIPNREDEEYGRLLASGTLWPNAVTRAPHVLPRVLYRMSKWELWRGFWLAAPPVLLVGWRGLRRRVTLPLLLALLAPLAVGWAAYSVHPTPAELVRVTWNRMLLQGLAPLLLLLALALRNVLRRSGLSKDF